MNRQSPHILSAALLLMVWIATPILAVVHGVVERHTYCAEHERVEDAVESHITASLLKGDEPRDDEAQSKIGRGETPEHSEGHEDCAFGDSFTREILVFTFDLVFAPAQLALTRPGTPPIATGAAAVALFRIAPKNSPPITA